MRILLKNGCMEAQKEWSEANEGSRLVFIEDRCILHAL